MKAIVAAIIMIFCLAAIATANEKYGAMVEAAIDRLDAAHDGWHRTAHHDGIDIIVTYTLDLSDGTASIVYRVHPNGVTRLIECSQTVIKTDEETA